MAESSDYRERKFAKTQGVSQSGRAFSGNLSKGAAGLHGEGKGLLISHFSRSEDEG